MKQLKAYTLVEILIYIALSGGVLMAGVKFLWDFVRLQVKDELRQEVVNSQVFSLSRFASLVGQARRVNSISSDQLDLDIGGNTKSLRLNDGVLEEEIDGQWYTLGQANDEMVGEFVDQNSDDSRAKIVSLRVNTSRRGESLDWNVGVSLKGQYSQGRQVLGDVSRAYLEGSDNQILKEVYLRNVGQTSVNLVGLKASWANSNYLSRVVIDGVEAWSGSASSGEEVTWSARSLGADQEVKFELDFESSLDGVELDLEFKLEDKSWVLAKLIPTSAGGEVVITCDSYCQDLGYGGGICRNNSWSCLWNGETHEDGGDQYCTGGSSSDTCCCSDEDVKTCDEVCKDLGYDQGTCRRNARACRKNNETHEDEGDQWCTGGSSSDTCCCGGGTPTKTCADVCEELGYDDGTCRKNSRDCRRNNETHERDGDPYCTGGPSEDTCCCKDDWWWGGGGLW